jgi:hypothetical protein
MKYNTETTLLETWAALETLVRSRLFTDCPLHTVSPFSIALSLSIYFFDALSYSVPCVRSRPLPDVPYAQVQFYRSLFLSFSVLYFPRRSVTP